MLIDRKGRAFDPRRLPKGRDKREAVLASLTEVVAPRHNHGNLFNLGERARLKEKTK